MWHAIYVIGKEVQVIYTIYIASVFQQVKRERKEGPAVTNPLFAVAQVLSYYKILWNVVMEEELGFM